MADAKLSEPDQSTPNIPSSMETAALDDGIVVHVMDLVAGGAPTFDDPANTDGVPNDEPASQSHHADHEEKASPPQERAVEHAHASESATATSQHTAHGSDQNHNSPVNANLKEPETDQGPVELSATHAPSSQQYTQSEPGTEPQSEKETTLQTQPEHEADREPETEHERMPEPEPEPARNYDRDADLANLSVTVQVHPPQSRLEPESKNEMNVQGPPIEADSTGPVDSSRTAAPSTTSSLQRVQSTQLISNPAVATSVPVTPASASIPLQSAQQHNPHAPQHMVQPHMLATAVPMTLTLAPKPAGMKMPANPTAMANYVLATGAFHPNSLITRHGERSASLVAGGGSIISAHGHSHVRGNGGQTVLQKIGSVDDDASGSGDTRNGALSGTDAGGVANGPEAMAAAAAAAATAAAAVAAAASGPLPGGLPMGMALPYALGAPILAPHTLVPVAMPVPRRAVRIAPMGVLPLPPSGVTELGATLGSMGSIGGVSNMGSAMGRMGGNSSAGNLNGINNSSNISGVESAGVCSREKAAVVGGRSLEGESTDNNREAGADSISVAAMTSATATTVAATATTAVTNLTGRGVGSNVTQETTIGEMGKGKRRGSSKNTLGALGGEGLTAEERTKQKRMLRNRESAARSRDKQKTRNSELEAAIVRLREHEKSMSAAIVETTEMIERMRDALRRCRPDLQLPSVLQ